MKICLIFRSKERKEYSIENVFGNITTYLSEMHDIDNEFVPSGRYNSILNIFRNIRFVKGLKADIFHITGEIHFLVPFMRRSRTVLTIHDMVMIEQTHGVKRFLYKLFWLNIPVRMAGAVTCISEKTKDDIVNIYPEFRKKITVIPNSYNDIFKPTDKSINTVSPLILAMGTRSNKNLIRIIDAVSGTNCRLLIVGKLSKEQEEVLRSSKVEYENLHNLSNEEIYDCYCRCDILCFPSLYEGFGMPIIEAQAVGRPVITSTWRPMNDIAGDGALLVNPEKTDEIRNAIQILINDKTVRNRVIKAGFENVKKYDPNVVANMYVSIYENLIDGNSDVRR